MKINKNIDEAELCKKYENGEILTKICTEYKIGKLKAKDILIRNGIKLRDKNSPKIIRNYIVKDFHIKKYENTDSFYYVAISKVDGTEFNDSNNEGGHLTSYIRKVLNIEVPSLYDRRIYYQTTGNYWWEQFFTIEKRSKELVKKCPYCNWETVDIENKSGALGMHLLNKHGITIQEHIKNYPEDINYFKKYKKEKEKETKLEDNKNFIICPICCEKYEKLTLSHIKLHGYNNFESIKKDYPSIKLLSDNMQQQILDFGKQCNLTVSKNRFISKYEKEIQEYLTENNIKFEANRQILEGKEIDILVPSKKIGIEFNGLKWHTEWFGKKNHRYHLDKTILCNKHGYDLIHIFEDEYYFHKEIVFHKISHLLNLDNKLPKIYGRKCKVKEIFKNDAEIFLNKYHIQGFTSSSIYVGCFYENNLIGVMTFKKGNLKNPYWELTRFATDYNYVCSGVGGKMFNYFIKNYNPEKIVSFADRRWTIKPYNNLYTKLGFSLEKFNPPDYRYYTDRTKDESKYKRIHKMFLNKQKLHKKYGFPLTMTETEMAKELGYDRIWDCGLIKYIWEK